MRHMTIPREFWRTELLAAGLLALALMSCNRQTAAVDSPQSQSAPSTSGGGAPPILLNRDFAAETATSYFLALINGDPTSAEDMMLQGHTPDDDAATERAAQALQGCSSAGLQAQSTMAVPEDAVTATFTPPCGNASALDPALPPSGIAQCTLSMRTYIGSWVPEGAPSCTTSSA